MEKYKILILTIFAIGRFISAKQCPEHQICVPVQHCSSINERLYQPQLNESEINYLRNLQCNCCTTSVYVCCNSSLPKIGECGNFDLLKTKISNGIEADLGQFPWTVLIGRRWKEANNRTGISYECGGSIINDRYILTAAHCVKFFSYTNYKERIKTIEMVKLGEWNTDTDPDVDNDGVQADPVVEMKVEKIIPHKDYRILKKYHDIALLKLEKKINFTKYIQPICLPHPRQSLDQNLEVIGWGKTHYKNENGEKIQRYATVNLVDNEACDKNVSSKIESTQLCAGSAGKDSCGGDSGGPLIGKQTSHKPYYCYLAGIVSFGAKECGTDGKPGVYTDVRKYVNWIEQNIIHDIK